MSDARRGFDRDGFAALSEPLPKRLLEPMAALFAKGSAGSRFAEYVPQPVANALAFPPLAEALKAIDPLLRPVRVLLFSKQPGANWFVPWHSDAAVAIEGDAAPHGFASRTVKDDVVHWEAPNWLLERMVTVRMHIDAAGKTDGPLEVVPGSHVSGVSTGEHAVACLAKRGEIHFMRPLLLHRSRKAEAPSGRRTVQIEMAPRDALPTGLNWRVV